jgi:hypothetical protein
MHMMRATQLRNLLLTTSVVFGLVGCTEKEGVEERTKINRPEGTTTITKDTKVETSGNNPPPVTNPGTSKRDTPNP